MLNSPCVHCWVCNVKVNEITKYLWKTVAPKVTKSVPLSWSQSISHPINSTDNPLRAFMLCTVFVYTLTPNISLFKHSNLHSCLMHSYLMHLCLLHLRFFAFISVHSFCVHTDTNRSRHATTTSFKPPDIRLYTILEMFRKGQLHLENGNFLIKIL